MHPLGAADWNRDDVYRYLGFTSFTTLEDLDQDEENFIREITVIRRISRGSSTDMNRRRRGPLFLFNVTMQNHGGYGQETLDGNWQVSTDLSALGDYPQAELFFSLMKETDQAIEKLVTYFSQVEIRRSSASTGSSTGSRTIFSMCSRGAGGEYPTRNGRKNIRRPFVIWANYDIEETTIDKIGANYLGPMLLRYAEWTCRL